MTWLWWWLICASCSIISDGYLASTLGLLGVHRIRAWFLERSGTGQVPQPFTWMHPARRGLRWPALIVLVPGLAANAMCQQARHLPGWDAEEWVSLAVFLALWLLVQRWHGNRDCNCADSHRHRRRKAPVVSRVRELAGRLVVAPAPAS